jgi:hypothetical protein
LYQGPKTTDCYGGFIKGTKYEINRQCIKRVEYECPVETLKHKTKKYL